MILCRKNSVRITGIKPRSNHVSRYGIMEEDSMTAPKKLEGLIHLAMNLPITFMEEKLVHVIMDSWTRQKHLPRR